MRKTLLALVAILAIAALAGPAFAQTTPAVTPDQAPGLRGDAARPVPCILPTLRLISLQMLPTLFAKLNLNEDAKTKVMDVLTKADKDIRPKIEDQNKAARDYTALLANPNVTQAELTAAADKAAKAESEVLMVRIQGLFALKAVLTADQNKQLAEYLDQSAKAWRERTARPATPAASPAK